MIKLGIKAETLERLCGKLRHAKILSQYSFTVKDWKNGVSNRFWKRCLGHILGQN